MRAGLIAAAVVLSATSWTGVAGAHPGHSLPTAWAFASAPALLAQPTPTPTPIQPAFTTGLPLREPPVVRSVKGRLKQTLVARNGTIEVSGVRVDATQTYGIGTRTRGLLGPTLQVQPGDLIDLVLDNRLSQPAQIPAAPASGPAGDHESACAHDTTIPAGHPQPTNLHFHGLHVTPRNHKVGGVTYYGDNVFACLREGRSHIRFRIPRDHDRGTFWYHAHLHGLTDDQVYRGLAGMLLVGDSRTLLPERLRRVRTRLLSIKDIQAVQDGGRWSIPSNHFWGNATTRTVNGLVMPRITIRPGETQLWRLANPSSGLWYKVALQDGAGTSSRYTIVARDGNHLVAPHRVTEALLGPGQRLDVLVRAPRSGTLTLRTLPFDQGFTTFPQADLATVEVTGASARNVASPQRSGRLHTFPSRRGRTRSWRFSVVVKDGNPIFKINDKIFDPTRPDARPRLGTTERWVLLNESSEWHPIHIHQDDFRVRTVDGKRIAARSDQDVVALPPAKNGVPGRVELDMPFQRYSGNFVMHCHILDHEDGGMMARIDVRK